ncbi:4-hydroxyphenylpyruvate dioxygenase [Actinoplanes sp. LDG1-06]|uniref:4-hydroxyphenylpyruvate dioxygenase n=1 Tax=Paractinoplanes ovalisporus TaxID=2810368 RepID=A0ABS2AI75_9ACTN|nr:4-hydroxyphenylpyruvate dioxygenase [Actinoplanes ovalisporus]MBM2619510.1 4-hydroxyphenylpyruvate dioxygenase [Actinoplanes ovalisporus]
MSSFHADVFSDLTVDHVVFYVSDLESKARVLTEGFGLGVVGVSTASDSSDSRALASSDILVVLSEPRGENHPGTAYLDQHGDGVADIALGAPDAAAAFAEAVRRGARPVSEPVEQDGFVTASIMGFGDVVHTFVQRPDGGRRGDLPAFDSSGAPRAAGEVDLGKIDHFAVCLEAGQLEPTVEFYEQVLDFRTIFEERIVVGAQAMLSKVVQSASGHVTLTLIEPDVTRDSGQIDDFLKNHGGAGVQHIALTTGDIVRTVGTLGERGIPFLSTPGAYYDLLVERMRPDRHEVEDLRRLSLLVDEDHDGQLYQIFTRSAHPRNTYFWEVIERAGARTFGSGNIKALYEAVEQQRNAAFEAENGSGEAR